MVPLFTLILEFLRSDLDSNAAFDLESSSDFDAIGTLTLAIVNIDESDGAFTSLSTVDCLEGVASSRSLCMQSSAPVSSSERTLNVSSIGDVDVIPAYVAIVDYLYLGCNKSNDVVECFACIVPAEFADCR